MSQSYDQLNLARNERMLPPCQESFAQRITRTAEKLAKAARCRDGLRASDAPLAVDGKADDERPALLYLHEQSNF